MASWERLRQAIATHAIGFVRYDQALAPFNVDEAVPGWGIR